MPSGLGGSVSTGGLAISKLLLAKVSAAATLLFLLGVHCCHHCSFTVPCRMTQTTRHDSVTGKRSNSLTTMKSIDVLFIPTAPLDSDSLVSPKPPLSKSVQRLHATICASACGLLLALLLIATLDEPLPKNLMISPLRPASMCFVWNAVRLLKRCLARD